MSRVAVVGSCITRDLWRFRGETGADLLYISRTSFPSLFATPLKGFRPAKDVAGTLRGHQQRALLADIGKTALATLVAFRPTHLIFDFIDERFDLLSVGGTLVSDSWELEVSGYRDQKAFSGARTVPRLSAACDRLWLDAAREFADLIAATPLAQAQLILHSARWADRQRLAGGAEKPVDDIEVLTGRTADLGAHNALLARYDAALAGLLPQMATVAAPQHRLADAAHQWGLSPFHYVPEYYAEIWRQLAELGVLAPLPA